MKNLTKKTILVVEDEDDVLDYLVTFFEDNGYNVITANNGNIGFEKALNNDPDLISLDISMPKETGIRMYQNLSTNPATKDIPVIIVTGFTSEFKNHLTSSDKINAPAGFFEKPINRQEILVKVKKIIG